MTPTGHLPRRFAFRFSERYARAGRRFGITPERSWVTVDDDRLEARYGPWRVTTALSNVARIQITGPYRFLKTAGPARLGVTDLSLTFASNGDAGVEIGFRERVKGIEPLGLLRHGALTLTVENPEELRDLLSSLMRRA